MIDAVVAMTTTNSEREAKSLAGILVRERHAACVQIVPKILSVYEWEGAIHEEQEYLLLIKTPERCVKDLKKAIEKHHSYEVPEFVVLPIIDGSAEYLEWMADVTK